DDVDYLRECPGYDTAEADDPSAADPLRVDRRLVRQLLPDALRGAAVRALRWCEPQPGRPGHLRVVAVHYGRLTAYAAPGRPVRALGRAGGRPDAARCARAGPRAVGEPGRDNGGVRGARHRFRDHVRVRRCADRLADPAGASR